MRRHICRLCGRENDEGNYCPACVPNWSLRKSICKINVQRANMALVDYRARRGISARDAARRAHVHSDAWRKAELDRSAPVSRHSAVRIAAEIGVPVEELFDGQAPAPENLKKHKRLKPGENQRLLEQDCAKAKQAGYGAHYGKWRADLEGRG